MLRRHSQTGNHATKDSVIPDTKRKQTGWWPTSTVRNLKLGQRIYLSLHPYGNVLIANRCTGGVDP